MESDLPMRGMMCQDLGLAISHVIVGPLTPNVYFNLTSSPLPLAFLPFRETQQKQEQHSSKARYYYVYEQLYLHAYAFDCATIDA